MKPLDCPWCGAWTRPIMIRGHYECGRCKRPITDCCDGEQAQIKESNNVEKRKTSDTGYNT